MKISSCFILSLIVASVCDLTFQGKVTQSHFRWPSQGMVANLLTLSYLAQREEWNKNYCIIVKIVKMKCKTLPSFQVWDTYLIYHFASHTCSHVTKQHLHKTLCDLRVQVSDISRNKPEAKHWKLWKRRGIHHHILTNVWFISQCNVW